MWFKVRVVRHIVTLYWACVVFVLLLRHFTHNTHYCVTHITFRSCQHAHVVEHSLALRRFLQRASPMPSRLARADRLFETTGSVNSNTLQVARARTLVFLTGGYVDCKKNFKEVFGVTPVSGRTSIV